VRAGWTAGFVLVLAGLGIVLLSGCYSRGQRLYQRAEAFLAQGDSALAAKEYRRLAIEQPRSVLADDALYKLAYLFREDFADPTSAITTYQMLADNYPDSPYADDALLWVAYIQRRDLKSPEAVRATYEVVCSRFPERKQKVARCYLQLVHALYAAGKYEQAMAEAQLLEKQFPGEQRQAATAALIHAKAAEKHLGEPQQVLEHYERIVEKYPGSYSAAEAKRAIGRIYYDERADDLEKTEQALRAAARVIHGVPRFSGSGSARRQQLAALNSLLAFHKVSLDEQTVLALSGAAFDFLYKSQDPSVGGRKFIRNPYVLVAETLGFTTNEWSAPDAESSFSALRQAIRNGRPVLVQQSSPRQRWVIVTGYRPARDQIFYMTPDRDSTSVTTKANFLRTWSSSKARGFGSYYQFSIVGRQHTPEPSEILREALRTAVSAMEGRKVAGVPSGMEAYRTLEQDLAGQPSDNLPKLLSWTEEQLPELKRCRKAAGVFLRQQASILPGRKSENLLHAAGIFQSIEQELETLAGAIQRASGQPEEGEPSDTEGWQRAAKQLRFIMDLEQQAGAFLQQSIAG